MPFRLGSRSRNITKSLLGIVKDHMESDLKRHDQPCASIAQVLSTQRPLMHYGSLSSMTIMSEPGSRHRILETSYAGRRLGAPISEFPAGN